MIRIGLVGTNNTHGHQFAGFINGWREDVPIPTRWKHGPLPQFYDWAKTLRRLELAGEVPAEDARVTRLWSESPDTEGALIAQACGIDSLVDSPQDATRDVDAVLLLTDDPVTRFELAAPVLRAGLPMFIDKPLAPDAETLRRLGELAERHNTPWFSGSALRYSPSLAALRDRLPAEIGAPTAAYVQCSGWIEEYGIHALEILNALLGHDIHKIDGLSLPGRSSALIQYADGVTAMLETVAASLDPPAQVIVWGNKGSLHWHCRDIHTAIHNLTTAFLDMTRTHKPPTPPTETLQLAHIALTLNTTAT